MDDLRSLLDLAVVVARQAGDLLLDGLTRVRTTVETKSTRTDMVTEMDRASERLVVTALRAARPDDGILGEEGTESTGTSGVRWVIDPIDGTTNYLYGIPAWTVSIAAQVDDVSVVGVVHDAAHAETFTAIRGVGAWCNGEPLRVEGAPDLATALVCTGFAYDAVERGKQAAALAHVLPAVRDIRRAGAASLDLCWVARGRADAYFERGLAPWDWAAGALVATEAGASVGVLDDGTWVAAAPQLYGPLCELVVAAQRLTSPGLTSPAPGASPRP